MSDRTVIARMDQYMNKSDSTRVEIEELESTLGTKSLGMRRIFAIFRSKGQSEHLAASKCDGMSVKG